jgi:hypothetical protein
LWTVLLGDSKDCEVSSEGTIQIEKFINRAWITAHIDNVLYVLSLKKNLFSVGVCTSKSLTVHFINQRVNIVNNNCGKIMLQE